eukprot:817763-Prorocentrum_minimum.AAC.2
MKRFLKELFETGVKGTTKPDLSLLYTSGAPTVVAPTDATPTATVTGATTDAPTASTTAAPTATTASPTAAPTAAPTGPEAVAVASKATFATLDIASFANETWKAEFVTHFKVTPAPAARSYPLSPRIRPTFVRFAALAPGIPEYHGR